MKGACLLEDAKKKKFSSWRFQALHLQGRNSTASAMPPVLFDLVILERWGLAFCPGQPGLNPPILRFLPLLLGWQASATTPSFFPLTWGLENCLPWLASN
jgi:hypothetical protein